MQLRDYQAQMSQDFQTHWDLGFKVLLGVLPTGGGKSVILANEANKVDGGVALIAHRQELVSQLSFALARCGIQHGIVAAAGTISAIVRLHVEEFGRSFYSPNSLHRVCSIDTLIRMPPTDPWLARVKLWICDEGHHLARGNKWEKGIAMFPRNARGLSVTATPLRADGKGLGSHADGLVDAMIEGPRMRELIDRGYLTDYMIWCPPSDIDLSGVGIAPSGDYSPEGVRKAVHQSKQIVGDVVQHYLKVAPGLRGVTFCVDIESATEICEEYRHYGVPAEVLTGKTPDLVRAQILRKLRDGSILQVTSVDVLSEGFDLPAIEAISFARPTESYGLFAQQFGRGLRTMPGKTHARIIDHVGNVIRHRPPDAYREWSLDRRERRSKSAPSDVIPMRACPQCTRPYERHLVGCPYCGFFPEPAGRGTPEQVEGDLALLTPEVLAKMRGDLARVDAGVVNVPYGADPAVAGRLHRIARERNEALTALRCSMDQYGGIMAAKGASPRETSRAFYQQFGIDVISAQLLNANDSNALRERIERTWK